MSVLEVNFDGLIGPTHNYSGLSHGNLASQSHADMVSHPKAAALQGINKMRTLLRLGYPQGFFPPQRRPELGILRQLGFTGSEVDVLKAVSRDAPHLLTLVYSASSMWAANAATVTPSLDAPDGKVHLTAANLVTTMHRAIECQHTTRMLQQVFSADCFEVHPPITAHQKFGDEGAANHSRLCDTYDQKGVGLFVHGDGDTLPLRFPARQTLEASRGVARQHGVIGNSVFLQQHPDAIDGGAFHNDVVAVANGPVLFYHESAYLPETLEATFAQIRRQVQNFQPICVPASEVTLLDAIQSYLFNSQLLASPDGKMTEMTLVAPMECQENTAVRQYLEKLSRDHSQPIRDVVFVDVRQSMSNGGGPACLRLRVALTSDELNSVDQRFIADDAKLDALEAWVSDFYRDDLHPQDLADPAFMDEAYRTLKALELVLGIEGFYEFG